jgi:hypothetical protein
MMREQLRDGLNACSRQFKATFESWLELKGVIVYISVFTAGCRVQALPSWLKHSTTGVAGEM